jgi:hypothetical protein
MSAACGMLDFPCFWSPDAVGGLFPGHDARSMSLLSALKALILGNSSLELSLCCMDQKMNRAAGVTDKLQPEMLFA